MIMKEQFHQYQQNKQNKTNDHLSPQTFEQKKILLNLRWYHTLQVKFDLLV